MEECENADNFILIEVNEEKSEGSLCTVCGMKFSNRGALREHAADEHENDDTCMCNTCDESFVTKGKLTTHIRNVHESTITKEPIVRSTNGKFQCPVCDKEFCRKLNASQHFMSHVAEKNQQCETCQFRCHTQTQLAAHMKKHEKRFCCEMCSKMFAYKFQLDIHVQGVHYNLRPFPCKLCGKTFKTRYNYGSHMAQHKDIRNFQCPFCPRKCRKNYDLRIHIRTHTGEKPYSCTYCQRAYSQNGDRMKHERHCQQKTSVTLLVERYPDNEVMEVASREIDDQRLG